MVSQWSDFGRNGKRYFRFYSLCAQKERGVLKRQNKINHCEQRQKEFFYFAPRPPLFFLRFASNAFPDFGSVGRIGKKKGRQKKKNQEESGTRRPGIPESLPWRLETRRGYKINKTVMEEEKIDVVVKIQ